MNLKLGGVVKWVRPSYVTIISYLIKEEPCIN